MRWPFPTRTGTLALACLTAAGLTTAQADPAAWSFDVLRLKNGTRLNGLIVRETDDRIDFRIVHRKPGRPTVVFETHFRPGEVTEIDRLDVADRRRLHERLDALESSEHERRDRPDQLTLKPAPWRGNPDAALSYDSDYFRLVSTAPEPIVRRAAVRLEQIYAAYVRFLPPRHAGGRPTTVLLSGSHAEYAELLREAGHDFRNPAFYEPSSNRIVCGTNLTELGDDIERFRARHVELDADLDRQEQELRRLYGRNTRDLERYLQPIREMRRRIRLTEAHNFALIDEATRNLFATLYHEAFHAYVANFVYVGDDELPRWLNEGLAQIFETALIEGDELRVGHADRRRLMGVRDLMRRGELLPLADLLRNGSDPFRVGHLAQTRDADRAYLTAWAVAFHLTFERRLLGTSDLDEYTSGRGDPVARFEKLVGTPLARYERELHHYLGRLQPDGSLTDFSIRQR